jgi:hypothetical protein
MMKTPRHGKVNLWDYSDFLADEIAFETEYGKPKKIEVRFYRATPVGVAILHTTKGAYAFTFNSDYISERDIEEYFHKKIPEHISDSLPAGAITVYNMIVSDADLNEFKVSKLQLRRLREQYNDYTLDIIL